MLACMAALGGAAPAAALQDPMRPTPGSGAARSGASAEPAAAEPAAVSGAESATPPSRDGMRLVTIRRLEGSAHRALIGEQWVGAGDRIDGWRVTGIDGEEVRLEKGAEKLALRLWPQLHPVKTEPADAAAAAKAAPRTRAPR
jgi:hypothetical protein